MSALLYIGREKKSKKKKKKKRKNCITIIFFNICFNSGPWFLFMLLLSLSLKFLFHKFYFHSLQMFFQTRCKIFRGRNRGPFCDQAIECYV